MDRIKQMEIDDLSRFKGGTLTKTCEVCNGTGEYPIINKYGQQLYCIACPQCQ